MSVARVSDRRKSEFEQLLSLPWWAGVAAGLFAYAVVGWFLPKVLATDATFADLWKVMQIPALLALGLCLMLSAASTVRQHVLRRRFIARNGIEDVRHLGRREWHAQIAAAFRRRGYDIAENRCAGVDIVLLKDGRRYFVRCKQWKVFNVGVSPLADLHTRMTEEAAAGGFFISSGVFTRDARSFAAEVNIELVGGTALHRFLNTDEAPAAVRPYPEPVFLSSTAMTIPVCPSCGNPMIRRVAKFGKTAGEEFWGCGQFPHCRGTRGI